MSYPSTVLAEPFLRNGKPVVRYHYRGQIERGSRYEWKEGYSPNSPEGRVIYPWLTRSECRAEAKANGVIPLFCRGGECEDEKP